MWAFVTLGLLWIEQPRLGSPDALADRFTREAEAMSGAVLFKRAKYDTTCSLDMLHTFDMDLSLCNVSLNTEPVLILERATDEHGIWMRLAFVQNKKVTRHEDAHVAIDGDALAMLSTLIDRMFKDYGDVRISGQLGMELFVDGKWMGALGKERRLRLPPGQHALDVRKRADVYPLGNVQVLAKSDYDKPLKLGVNALAQLER